MLALGNRDRPYRLASKRSETSTILSWSSGVSWTVIFHWSGGNWPAMESRNCRGSRNYRSGREAASRPPHALGGFAVQAANFEVSHLVDAALLKLEYVIDGGVGIVGFRRWLDLNAHVAAGSVEFFQGFHILVGLHGVRRFDRVADG